MEIKKTLTKEKLNILILADYSDGNRAAIHFAMRYLYCPDSVIHIIQTWQKPNFGSSMVRDLSPMLAGIANNELENLKNYLQDCYSMPDDQVNLIAFEGDLGMYFRSSYYQNKEWKVVIGSNNYETLFNHNHRMNELIDHVSEDLFILVGLEPEKSINEIFLLADTERTEISNLSLLKRITISEKPNINVCLSQIFESKEDREKRILPLIETCKGAKLSLSQIKNGVGKNELKEFSKMRGGKLIIFEKNSKRKFKNGMRTCLDSWLLKSKGIRI